MATFDVFLSYNQLARCLEGYPLVGLDVMTISSSKGSRGSRRRLSDESRRDPQATAIYPITAQIRKKRTPTTTAIWNAVNGYCPPGRSNGRTIVACDAWMYRHSGCLPSSPPLSG